MACNLSRICDAHDNGAIIGIVYMISDRVRKLRIDSSTLKAFATGVATGIAVWAVLFVPLHFFLMHN